MTEWPLRPFYSLNVHIQNNLVFWPPDFSFVTLRNFSKENKFKRKSSWPQEFKGDAKVIAEVEKVLHVHHIVGIVFVLPSESFQDLQLHQGLVVKSEMIGEWQGWWEMKMEDRVSYDAAAVAHFLSPSLWPQQGRKHQTVHTLAFTPPWNQIGRERRKKIKEWGRARKGWL